MPNLLIDLKLEYIPGSLSNPKVLLEKLKRTIACTGNNFSRITKVVVSGATDPNLGRALLPIGSDIGDVGYILIENLGGGQVGVGLNPRIDCNITDGGGGTLNLYKAGHGLSSWSNLTINGSTYSGYYNVDSIVDVDNFKVIETYTSNENMVSVYSHSLCEVNLQENNFALFRVNGGTDILYAVGLADDVVLEVIAIED